MEREEREGNRKQGKAREGGLFRPANPLTLPGAMCGGSQAKKATQPKVKLRILSSTLSDRGYFDTTLEKQ